MVDESIKKDLALIMISNAESHQGRKTVNGLNYLIEASQWLGFSVAETYDLLNRCGYANWKPPKKKSDDDNTWQGG